MRKKLNAFFGKKITIARWQFNLFGLACFSVGAVWGVYAVISGVFPKSSASTTTSITIASNTDIKFSDGTFNDTTVGGDAGTGLQLIDGSWSAETDMPSSANGGGMIYNSNNNSIYFKPGWKPEGDANVFWRYDIGTKTWEALASAPETVNQTVAATFDGVDTIFVSPGGTGSASPSAAFWKYTISTNTWAVLADMPAGGFGDITFAGGAVYKVQGGTDVPTDSFFRYNIADDPANGIVANTWTSLASTPSATFVGDLVSDNLGHLFATGWADTVPIFWKYNIASDTWSSVESMLLSSYYGTMAFDGDESIYMTKGMGYDADGNFNQYNNVFWKYNVVSGVWTRLPDLPEGCSQSSMIADGNGNVYMQKGDSGANGSTTFWKYSMQTPALGNWESSAGSKVIDTYWNGGWGTVDTPTSSALETTVSGLSANKKIRFSVRTADSADGLVDSYATLIGGETDVDGWVTTNGVKTFTVADFESAQIQPKRFIQVKVEFEAPADQDGSQNVESFSIFYQKDDILPSWNSQARNIKIEKNEGGVYRTISQNDSVGWVDNIIPSTYKIVWDNAEDTNGVAGYCVYIGQTSLENGGEPRNSGGYLYSSSVNTYGSIGWGFPDSLVDINAAGPMYDKCLFIAKPAADPAETQSTVDFSVGNIAFERNFFNSNNPFFANIRAVDTSGNVSDDYLSVQFKVDEDRPTIMKYLSVPSGFIKSKTINADNSVTYNSITVTWPATGDDAANDINNVYTEAGDQSMGELSGIAGYQYKIVDNPDGDGVEWRGANGGLSANGFDLAIPYMDQNSNLVNSYTLTHEDLDSLKQGTNYFILNVCDNAGLCRSNSGSTAIIKINNDAPSSPNEVSVVAAEPVGGDYSVSKKNEYSFSWKTPNSFPSKSSDPKGDNLVYCYTVNTLPSVNSCSGFYTTAGMCSNGTCNLPADAFATQPGENTFYVVARDGDNINYETYGSVVFTYNGDAPAFGATNSVEVSDISIKATSNWKLALSWDRPELSGAGIEEYKVFRSTENGQCSAFDQVGSSTSTSFVDAGLEQKKYYYCIKACDSANNCGAASSVVSTTPTGKFTSPAEIVSGPKVEGISTSLATISWTTERASDSKISYGKSSDKYYDEEPSNSSQVTDHSISLNNLSPGTTYYFKAKWTDEDGNTGESEEKTFKTEPSPTVKDVKATRIGLSDAFIEFTTKGADKVKIYYGSSASFGFMKSISTSSDSSSYTAELSELTDNTKYYYKINSFDSEGQEYEGTTLDFTTMPRPKISNVNVQTIRDSAQPGILVTWNSNTEISSIVSYAPTNNPSDRQNEVQVELVSGEHEATIMNLKPSITYQLVVSGVDRAGNEAISDSYSFTTSSDTRPPKISEIVVEGSSTDDKTNKLSQLAVSWNTDEQSTSQVEFGEGVGLSYAQRTQEDSNLTNNHLVIISGLTPSKVYHLRILSKDQAGNISRSQDTVSITPKAVDSAFELVVGNLMEVFGFLRGLQN